MKKFILSCAFFLLTTLAFAQSIEEKASFLTNQMNTLLSLSTEQVEKVSTVNIRRFKFEANSKERLASQPRYEKAKSENFQSELGQAMLAEINTRMETAENRYDALLSKVLDASQYSLYLQNKQLLLDELKAEFGE